MYYFISNNERKQITINKNQNWLIISTDNVIVHIGCGKDYNYEINSTY